MVLHLRLLREYRWIRTIHFIYTGRAMIRERWEFYIPDMIRQQDRLLQESVEAAEGKRPVRLRLMAERYLPLAHERQEVQESVADFRLQVLIPLLTVELLLFLQESLLQELEVDEKHQVVTLPLTVVL